MLDRLHGKHPWRVGNQETSSICLGRITLLLSILGTGLFEARSLSTWWHLGRTLETGLTSFQKNRFRQKSSSFVLLCMYKRIVYICPIYIAWVLECNTIICICMIGYAYCLWSFEDNSIVTYVLFFSHSIDMSRDCAGSRDCHSHHPSRMLGCIGTAGWSSCTSKVEETMLFLWFSFRRIKFVKPVYDSSAKICYTRSLASLAVLNLSMLLKTHHSIRSNPPEGMIYENITIWLCCHFLLCSPPMSSIILLQKPWKFFPIFLGGCLGPWPHQIPVPLRSSD